MKLYNSLTRSVEEFKPINEGKVGMYTCGPTVYFYPQIGNWRTFVFEDIARRTLEFLGYEVTQVMNITDVGHLTGDNMGDADLGEDRMEKASKKENKTAWDIAEFYTKDFIESRNKLNIKAPQFLPRATEHITEQIDLVKKLFGKGLAYQTKKAIYFEVAKFPEYGRMGGQKLIDKRIATREELIEDPEKHNPFDFALWKFSPEGEKRQMEWESPWGMGFPGWHIECSAMSMKYLGESFDIHMGGIDHVAIHHANEIAQSEGATGKQFARYWLHGAFLTVDGGRMGKSLGNAYTLHDVVAKGFDPIALRLFYLGAHYRKQLNFTWDALTAAQSALSKMRSAYYEASHEKGRTVLSEEKLAKVEEYQTKFRQMIENDLDMPGALAITWEVLKSNIPGGDKAELLSQFDQVLGLSLATWKPKVMPPEVKEMMAKREELRKEKDFVAADEMRKKIEELGYKVEDQAL